MRPKMTWYYKWKGAHHPGLAERVSQELERAIRAGWRNRLLSLAEVKGQQYEQVLYIDGKACNLVFWLNDIRPYTEAVYPEQIDIQVVWEQDVWAQTTSMSHGGDEVGLSEYVMQEITYSPTDQDSHWHRLYEWLIGIDKESILRRLLIAFDARYDRRKWAFQWYEKIPRLLDRPQPEIPLFILSGDPGTGKTALATSIGAPVSSKLGEPITLIQLTMTLRGTGFQGIISKIIPKVFEQLAEKVRRAGHPCILLFDEADALMPSRHSMDNTSGAQENLAVVNGIIKELDKLREEHHLRVAVIFATNLIQRIDSALIRRCYYYEFQRPDDKWRWELLKSALRDFGISEEEARVVFENTAPAVINEATVLYSYSDIIERILLPAIDQSVYEGTRLRVDTILELAKAVRPTVIKP